MLFTNSEKIIENGETSELKKIRKDVLDIFSAAIDAVDPYNAVKSKFNNGIILINGKRFDVSVFKNVYLVGFGKASIGMAKAVCDSINIKEGIVITNESQGKIDRASISIIVGGHPIPNGNSMKGADKAVELIKKCDEKDLLIVLISGGGSALLTKPRVCMEDLQKTTDLLLKSGANINEINTIRKHLSFVKGGQLVKDTKCKVISFIISDIVDDPLEFIASGPTYPDSTTFTNAKEALEKYNLWSKVPKSVIKVIEDGMHGKIPDTPKKHDSIFDDVFNFIVANNKIACEAASKKAENLGYRPLILTTSLEGEAREVGRYLVEKAINHLIDGKKVVFISGGETTVTIKGNGRGGRNQEMVLSTIDLLDDKKVVFSSFATDGIDGKSDAAGAIADAFSYARAKNKNLDIQSFLNDNNSYEFFKQTGDLLITGPTGTNVMDIQILVKY